MNAEDSVRVPTQKRAVRTRGGLVAAAQQEFSTRGYAATTAKSIARAAGVSTGSFYQYFTDKDAVLRELGLTRFDLVRRGIETLLGSEEDPAEGAPVVSAGDPTANLRSIVQLVMAYHREDPGLHAVLTERRNVDAELDALTSDAEATFIAQIARLLSRWGHPGDVDAVAFVIFNMVEGAVHAHVLGHAMVEDTRFVQALVDALHRVALPDTPRNA